MPHYSQHHKNKRKPVHEKHQEYTHSNSRLRLLNSVCTVFSVLMPMTAIPQIYTLYTLQDAGSLSIWMWILYSIGVMPFLLYGIVHRVIHLIMLNVLWMTVQLIMIIGILMYG